MRNSPRRYLLPILCCSLALCALPSCTITWYGKGAVKPASKQFRTTPSGLQYRIVRDVPGTLRPGIGDYLEFHIRSHVGDSVLFDSRVLNNNEPVPLFLSEAAFRGDLTEGLMMLTEGDSAQFRVPVDSLIKSGNAALPFMQMGKGQKADYEIRITRVRTKAQYETERQEAYRKQAAIDDKLLLDYFAVKNIKAEKTPSGLYYRITDHGKGHHPKKGDTVLVSYTGRTLNGVTFDSNIEERFHHQEPFRFQIYENQVIKGWDEGLSLLKEGGKGTLYVPSGLAYSSQSPSPLIPANAILEFDVELIRVLKKEN